MALCFGVVKPRRLKASKLNDVLTLDDLGLLSLMVEREVIAGLKKDLSGPGPSAEQRSTSSTDRDPHPYDLCLMEKIPEERGKHSLAVCVPVKRKGKKSKSELMWYDGNASFWTLEERQCKWRVASLSGGGTHIACLREGECCHFSSNAVSDDSYGACRYSEGFDSA
jgi:hypothetical protein